MALYNRCTGKTGRMNAWIGCRVRHPAVRPPSALICPLKSKGGQRGARAEFGHILDFLVLKAVQRGDARIDILARSGQTANIQRPCRTLIGCPSLSST